MSTFTVPVVTIKDVVKHPNADKLDLVTFNEIGWRCVSETGLHKVGDMVIYVPIDSNVNTAREEFSWLAPKAKSNGLHRVRTVKLRGEVSQGLIIKCPETIYVKAEDKQDADLVTAVPGDDALVHLGISKYEPPAEQVFSANAKGRYPTWLPKTDAERYQNWNRNIDEKRHNAWHASLKMDGTSLTVFYDAERAPDVIGVCSRNQELKDPSEDPSSSSNLATAYGFRLDTYWSTALKFGLINKVEEIALMYAAEKVGIQGEICGPGIQKNHLGLTANQFYMFDVFIVNKHFAGYLDRKLFMGLAAQMDIPTVPELWVGTLEEKLDYPLNFDFISQMEYPSGHPVEGVVFVPAVEQQAGNLGRLKFKYINPEFLLKEKD